MEIAMYIFILLANILILLPLSLVTASVQVNGRDTPKDNRLIRHLIVPLALGLVFLAGQVLLMGGGTLPVVLFFGAIFTITTTAGYRAAPTMKKPRLLLLTVPAVFLGGLLLICLFLIAHL
jgi:hypothetical protein